MNAAPGDARVGFLDGDFAELGFDVGGGEADFVETGPRFGMWSQFVAFPLTPAQ